MEIPDLIGFIVSVMAVLFLIGRHLMAQRYRQQHPEEAALEEQKQKETLKKFLKSLNADMEDLEEEEKRPKVLVRKPPPAPPQMQKAKSHRKVDDDFRFKTRIEQRRLETAIEQRQLQTSIDARKFDYGADLVSSELQRQHDAYRIKPEKMQPASQVHALVARIGSKKEMLILQEILNPPRAFGKEGMRDRL